jgi:hypothetical protein
MPELVYASVTPLTLLSVWSHAVSISTLGHNGIAFGAFLVLGAAIVKSSVHACVLHKETAAPSAARLLSRVPFAEPTAAARRSLAPARFLARTRTPSLNTH